MPSRDARENSPGTSRHLFRNTPLKRSPKISLIHGAGYDNMLTRRSVVSEANQPESVCYPSGDGGYWIREDNGQMYYQRGEPTRASDNPLALEERIIHRLCRAVLDKDNNNMSSGE